MSIITTEAHTNEDLFIRYPSITNSYALDTKYLSRLAAAHHTEFVLGHLAQRLGVGLQQRNQRRVAGGGAERRVRAR